MDFITKNDENGFYNNGNSAADRILKKGRNEIYIKRRYFMVTVTDTARMTSQSSYPEMNRTVLCNA